MNTSMARRRIARGCAAALVLASTLAQAQTGAGRIRPATQPAAPAMPTPGTTGFGMPNPAGLASQFPAGLPSPPGAAPGSPPVDATVAPETNSMGAGAHAAAPADRPAPAQGVGPYTALQIAQSFIGADLNRDGDLTRAEAQRLTIAPYSFDEMDRNHDGVLTRFEYEDAVR